MSGEFIAFFILAILAIGGGVLMLNVNKVIHMVMSLVITFLSIAGIYVLLTAEFVAVIQVLIYSGAISIIMLFGIMLTKHHDVEEKHVSKSRITFVVLGILAFFGTMYYAIRNLTLTTSPGSFDVNNTKQIGTALYSNYIIPFEVTSVLLLVALVGAILLAKREGREKEGEEK